MKYQCYWDVFKGGIQYVYVAIGPIGGAAMQFLLSLQLLHSLTSLEFGGFSFLYVASALFTGVWSALFCAPLPILIYETKATDEREATEICLHSASLFLSILVGVLFLCLAFWIGNSAVEAWLFAVFVTANLIRTFARARGYANGWGARTILSDNLYTAMLLLFIVAMYMMGNDSLTMVYVALLVSAVTSLIPFGRGYFVGQFMHVNPASIIGYSKVWREHSRWSLLGVLTTEATSNAHAYVVTWFAGPAAFAVISASALLARPLTVIMNALGDFERPRIASRLGLGDIDGAAMGVRSFRWAMIASWIGMSLLAALVLVIDPGIVFPKTYPLEALRTGGGLWMAVAAIRMLRLPESILLQAGGAFRELALASLLSSVASVVGVIVILELFGSTWSILGVLIGEVTFAIWVWREANLWSIQRKLLSPLGAMSP